jgi:phthalate 4,5-dioxygenase
MLTTAENELMCRVEPGTPMGAMLSEYWWPVVRSDKLEPDGDPERVRLLGRDFVAFRASDGRLGFFDEGCPHRAASLVLGRNEDCGLRCVLHGWKIDVSGKIVETPNEAAPVGDKKMAAHYPIRDAAGMVWVFVGEGEPAPFPELSFATCEPGTQVMAVRAEFDCNWVQLMETLWDPAHVGILHGSGDSMKAAWGDAGSRFASDEVAASPLAVSECETREEPWGFRFKFAKGGLFPEGGLMPGGAWQAFVMPSWQFIGPLGFDEESDRTVFGHVPVDDTHTVLWQLSYNPVRPLNAVGQTQANADNPDNWRPADAIRETNWGQDREAMRAGSWTGIGEGRGTIGLLMQDVAMSESMGGIVNREKEHLGPADAAVIKGRQVLLDAVRAHMNGEPALAAAVDVSNIGRPGGLETEPVDNVEDVRAENVSA